jgi:gamma-glutamyltranspeptidase
MDRKVEIGGQLATSAAAMVTSPHRLASEAGRNVLAAGGSAIDAAIAMGAVLAVVYPHFCGLGGDAIWLVSDENGRADTLSGIGQAAGTIERIPAPIPLRGPMSAITSACVVDSWGTAHDYAQERWGVQSDIATLLRPAIELAQLGFPLSRSQAFWLDFRREEAAGWPGFGAIYDTTGLDPEVDRIRQPQLAESLRLIARDGTRSFYEGELASRIAAGLQAAGSPLTTNDLVRTKTRIEAPVRLVYRDLELLAPPPPTQGVTTLEIMALLERVGIADVAAESADFYHLLVEAIKQAFLSRGSIGDPDFEVQDPTGWLAPERIAAKACQIDRRRALPWPHVFKQGDTVFFAAVDARGRTASVLQSLYFDWGSGVVAGDTGILWQNRGAAFSRDLSSPNRLRPGARPFYTLNPGIALKNDKPHLLYGTQGADGQPQTLATLLARVVDHGQDPAAALAAPRFLLGRTFSDSRDSLKIETPVGSGIIDELARRGHEISRLDPRSPIAGQAGLIRIMDPLIEGAHDPRSDGIALGL